MATYYIDPEFGPGGDGTFATPFDSWSDVTFGVHKFLQKESTVFSGTVTINVGGTADDARVMLGTYDATTGEQILDGSRRAVINANGGQFGVVVTGTRNYVTVYGLEVHNARHATGARGIYQSTSAGTHFNVIHCYVHDVRNTSTPTGAVGIQIFGDNAKVLHNVIRDMGDDGLYVEGDSVELAYNDISECSVDSTGGDCIQMADTFMSSSNPWVHHNTLDHTNVDTKQCFIITSGSAGGPSSGGIVEHNIMRGYEGAATHKAAYVGSPSMTLRNNRISGGIRSVDLDSNATGAKCYSNVITNSGTVENTNCIVVTANDQQVYNNTIINTSGAGANVTYGVQQSSSYTGVTVQNNAVQGWKYGVRVHSTNPATEDHNQYYKNTVNKVNNSLTEQALGTGSADGDPQLSPTYRPLPGSTLIAAGTHLGYTRDIDGAQRSNPPAIGALEPLPARSTASTRQPRI
jgi:hypothetical protein